MDMAQAKTSGETSSPQTTTPPIGKPNGGETINVGKGASNAKAPSMQEVLAELARLRAENTALKAKEDQALSMRVGQSGTLAVYGLGRFPEALYPRQWLRLLAEADKIRTFLETQFKLWEANPEAYKAGQVTGQAFHDYPAKDNQPAFRAILTFEKQTKTTKL